MTQTRRRRDQRRKRNTYGNTYGNTMGNTMYKGGGKRRKTRRHRWY
jgi:hypothetical protein